MADVGRYRKAYPRIWRHPGFRALSETGQRLALYLLTGPQCNRIGLYCFSIATAAEDLNVGVETLRKRLADVQATFGWLYDADARVLFVPSWWRWNQPENPNVLSGNLKDLNEVPPCALLDAFAGNIATLDPDLHETFIKRLPLHIQRRSANQKQEHYQDQEQENRASRGNERTATPTAGVLPPTRLDSIVRDASKDFRRTDDIELKLDTVRSFLRSNGHNDVPRAEILESMARVEASA
jgi:hypothetical protein